MTAATAKRVALYARVSTDDQTAENQTAELRAVAARHGWQVTHVFTDQGFSGAKGREARPGLDSLLKAVARREVDLVAAWSVCRLGRSLQHLLAILGELQAKKIDLYLHQQNLDTGSPAGLALFQLCGVFAQFERSLIVERVRAGQARAKAAGRHLGRPPAPSGSLDRAIAYRKQGLGVVKAAKLAGIGTGTLQRWERQHLAA